MIPKSGNRFPACAKPWRRPISLMDASAGEGRSDKIQFQIISLVVLPMSSAFTACGAEAISFCIGS